MIWCAVGWRGRRTRAGRRGVVILVDRSIAISLTYHLRRRRGGPGWQPPSSVGRLRDGRASPASLDVLNLLRFVLHLLQVLRLGLRPLSLGLGLGGHLRLRRGPEPTLLHFGLLPLQGLHSQKNAVLRNSHWRGGGCGRMVVSLIQVWHGRGANLLLLREGGGWGDRVGWSWAQGARNGCGCGS